MLILHARKVKTNIKHVFQNDTEETKPSQLSSRPQQNDRNQYLVSVRQHSLKFWNDKQWKQCFLSQKQLQDLTYQTDSSVKSACHTMSPLKIGTHHTGKQLLVLKLPDLSHLCYCNTTFPSPFLMEFSDFGKGLHTLRCDTFQH